MLWCVMCMYIHRCWLYFYTHPIWRFECFIIQVVGPNTSSLNIRNVCFYVYIYILFVIYIYVYLFVHISHIIYIYIYNLYTHHIHLLFHVFAELAAVLLSSGPMAFWRMTGSPDGLIHVCRLGGFKHISLNAHPYFGTIPVLRKNMTHT